MADGSGKAGLTFLTTSTTVSSCINAAATNAGGWEKSELRAKMNGGEIWNLLPSEFQSKVKAVNKLTNNVGGGDVNKNVAVTATSNKLFLLSYSEIAPTSYWASSYPWTSSEGIQYEAFKGKVSQSITSGNYDLMRDSSWWLRSVQLVLSNSFFSIGTYGQTGDYGVSTKSCSVCPAWCF